MFVKKALSFAVPLAFALAGTAMAANVTLYGRIDEGLRYVHQKTTTAEESNSVDTTSLDSGLAGASYWGIKGYEDLAPGWKIGFRLEGKFQGDDGTLGTDDTLFDRDSYLEVSSPYGILQAGRTAMLMSGSHGGIFAGQTNPFGVVYKEAGGSNVFQNSTQRVSNMLHYESPSLAGLKFYAQYSNATGQSTDYSEGNDAVPSSNRDRYGALGATFRHGGLKVALATDYYWFNHKDHADYDNPFNVGLAANYDFGSWKFYGGYQYGKHLRSKIFGESVTRADDGHMAMIGAGFDLWGGTLMTSAGYGHVGDYSLTSTSTKKNSSTTKTTTKSLDAWQLAVGYKYNLSKRTMLYGVGVYRDADLDATVNSVKTTTKKKKTTTTATVSDAGEHDKTWVLMVGLRTTF
jgi:predicted porin